MFRLAQRKQNNLGNFIEFYLVDDYRSNPYLKLPESSKLALTFFGEVGLRRKPYEVKFR
jgi:hypothetical protein